MSLSDKNSNSKGEILEGACCLGRLPEWLRRPVPPGSSVSTRLILGRHDVGTVCESARCPNQTECFSSGTAAFMILGNTCTRRCAFCAVETGPGEPVQADEPMRIAGAAREMGLTYVVVTSVTRDDLADEGAGQFAETIRVIRREIPEVVIEVLTPDFHARKELIARVENALPDVFNHNVETVSRLQAAVRPQASYERSLVLLATVKELNPEQVTKSGLMAGLGEEDDEILQAAADLRSAGCDILTLGQYLAPSRSHVPVAQYRSPEHFASLARRIKTLGFRDVFAGPHVRSSYHAKEICGTSGVRP